MHIIDIKLDKRVIMYIHDQFAIYMIFVGKLRIYMILFVHIHDHLMLMELHIHDLMKF